MLRAASGIGRYASLTAEEAYGVEYWPLELYKLTLAPPEQEVAGARYRPRKNGNQVLVGGWLDPIGRVGAHCS